MTTKTKRIINAAICGALLLSTEIAVVSQWSACGAWKVSLICGIIFYLVIFGTLFVAIDDVIKRNNN